MGEMGWIIGLLLAVGSAAAGSAKLAAAPQVEDMRRKLGYSQKQFRILGVAEIAAAVGIVAGLAWPRFEWVAIAAAIGIICVMLGALMAHARAEDEAKDIIPAVAMMLLAGLFIVVVSIR